MTDEVIQLRRDTVCNMCYSISVLIELVDTHKLSRAKKEKINYVTKLINDTMDELQKQCDE